MEFRVLGPLEVWANGVAVPLGTRKQQTVLALLALNPNRLVSVDELVDEVWPDGPPASAVSNVQAYAARLRRCLEAAGSGGRIARRQSGYLLHAHPDELDLLAFQGRCTEGRSALQLGDTETAVARFTAGLVRWRGAVIAGLPRGPLLSARCAAIEEERLTLVEDLAELHLTLADPGRAVALLREQVRTHPLRERAYAIVMRALSRTGDTAGALAVFADARAALADQLGIEPGRELQDLHRSLLRRDTERRPTGTVVPTPRPRELPPDVSRFVGRGQELARARAAIDAANRLGRHRAAVVVFHGPGGLGKSALAVHLAHGVANQYQDGQLYVDLLGSTPGLRRLSTAEVLRLLLRGLGVPEREIRHDVAGAAAQYRSVTADRRLLIVLDNAHDGDQLTPLLPAAGTSAVLITSRRPLAALEADHRIRLDGLPTRDCCALLGSLVEGTLASAVATRIVELCDRLPLAVRIVAGRLAGRPDLSPVEFAERLADRRRRLDELELDGLAIRSCIAVGYEALACSENRASRLASRAFKLMGLLNVPDLRLEVVAAML